MSAAEFYKEWVETPEGGAVLLIVAGDSFTPVLKFAEAYALHRLGVSGVDLKRLVRAIDEAGHSIEDAFIRRTVMEKEARKHITQPKKDNI